MILLGIIWRRKKAINLALGATFFTLGLAVFGTFIQVFWLAQSGIASNSESVAHNEPILLSKKISLSNTIGFADASFSQTDLNEITKKEFVSSVIPVESASFSVFMRAGSYLPFGTILFLESVPDSMLEDVPNSFNWHESDVIVPLIISKQFLQLYNLSLASTQSLPQLSEDLLKKVTLQLELKGNGKTQNFQARIVGFSNRYTSVFVPQRFLRAMSNDLGIQKQPKKVLLKLKEKVSKQQIQEFSALGYEVIGLNPLLTKVLSLLKGISLGLVCFGLVVVFLSILVLIQFLQNLIYKAKDEIKVSLELGYYISEIQKAVLLPVALVVIFATLLASFIQNRMIQELLKLPAVKELMLGQVEMPILSIAAMVLVSCALLFVAWLMLGRMLLKFLHG